MSEKHTLEANIEFGMALIDKESERFKEEAILRFKDFDAITNSVSPGNNWYTIGYATIVAQLRGEERVRAREIKERTEEAEGMMANLSSVVAGFTKQ